VRKARHHSRTPMAQWRVGREEGKGGGEGGKEGGGSSSSACSASPSLAGVMGTEGVGGGAEDGGGEGAGRRWWLKVSLIEEATSLHAFPNRCQVPRR